MKINISRKYSQAGIAHVMLLVGAVIILLIVGIGWQVHKATSHHATSLATDKQTTGKSIANSSSSKKDSASSSRATTTSNSTTAKSSTTSTKSTPTTGSNTNNGGSGSSAGSTQPPGPPTIAIISPTNGQVVSGNDITYDCSYTTPAGFSSVSASTVDQYGNDAHTAFTQGIENAGCNNDMDITYFDNGTYTVTFTIKDSLGRTATASRQFVVTNH